MVGLSNFCSVSVAGSVNIVIVVSDFSISI
jgi:hypothetical protein